MSEDTTIGVDVGGTKVAAGVVDASGRILARARRETPAQTPEGTLEALVATIEELRAGEHGAGATAIGIGAPGFVDERRSTVLFAPNIPDWRDEPLAEVVGRRTGLPTVVENDANAAAWAEKVHGAGAGEDHLVLVTVGTGIGGGVVVDGRLHRGRWGVAAEIGHMQVVPDGRPCGCGNRGCWEQYASGRALVAEARRRAAEDPAAAAGLLALGDGTAEGVTGLHVTAAAHDGDPVATAAFAEVGHWLGLGLSDLAAVLDPGLFIIGGGVSAAGEVLLDPTRAAFHAALSVPEHRPFAEVRAASLGNEAGIVGAAELARAR